MLSWLTSGVLSGILDPILRTVTAVFTKKEDTQVAKYTIDGKVNSDIIAAEVEIIKVKGELLKNQLLVYLQVGFGLPLMIYYGKCLLWDKVLGWGSTDALYGDISTYSMMIVSFLFLHSGIMAFKR